MLELASRERHVFISVLRRLTNIWEEGNVIIPQDVLIEHVCMGRDSMYEYIKERASQ